MRILASFIPPILLILALATYSTDQLLGLFLYSLFLPMTYLIIASATGRFLSPAIWLTYLLVLPFHFVIIYIVKIFVGLFRCFKWVYILVIRRHSAKKLSIIPRTFGDLLKSGHLSAYHNKPRKKLLLGHNRPGLVGAQIGGQVHHLLITAVTGQGKTTILRSILLSLLTKGPSIFEDWQFHIIDPKIGLGGHFQDIAQAHADDFVISHEPEDIEDHLESLYNLMRARTRKIQDARKDTPEQAGLGRVLVIIDDLQNIDADRKTQKLLLRLVNSSRAAGFHIIVAMPSAHSDIIKTYNRSNFNLIVGRSDESGTRITKIKAAFFLPDNHFLYQPTQLAAPIIFTPFVITGDMIRKFSSYFIAPKPTDVNLFILKLFCAAPGGLGWRQIIKRGYAERKSAGQPTAFPFSVYDPISGLITGPEHSKARDYILNLLREFAALGIASVKENRQGWAPLVDYPQAQRLYTSKERVQNASN